MWRSVGRGQHEFINCTLDEKSEKIAPPELEEIIVIDRVLDDVDVDDNSILVNYFENFKRVSHSTKITYSKLKNFVVTLFFALTSGF